MGLIELFVADLATTTVSSGGTDAPASGTQETLTVASAAMFGTAVTGVSQFHFADTAPGKGTEIYAATATSGTTWTVTRGAEGTTPVTHVVGFTIVQVATTGTLSVFAQAGVGVFNVLDYGAVGNGSHDDTAAWLAAFAAAIAAAIAVRSSAGNGVTVLFPPGGHYMLSAMDFSPAAVARVPVGVIADGAILQHSNAAGGVFVNFSGTVSVAALLYCSFTGALLVPAQQASNPTTDLVFMTVASHNILDVKVFDPGMRASQSGSAVHVYARAGSGCYYNTISMDCSPLAGYSTAYNGYGLTLDGWAAGGPYIQSNSFPKVIYQHSPGVGVNDLGSGVNVFTWCDAEYAGSYGLVVSTNSQGLRFLNFYMEGCNGVTGDQWSIPAGSANAGTSTFAGNLSVTPTDADRSYWAYYQDNAYGGVQTHAGVQYNYAAGSQYPKFYVAEGATALGARVEGDTVDRMNIQVDSGGLPFIGASINGTSSLVALEFTAVGTSPAVGPGSAVGLKPYGGEVYRYTSKNFSTSPAGTPYSVQLFDRYVVLDCTAGDVGLHLPSGQTPDGARHTFAKIDSTANTAVITPTGGSYTINGAADLTLSAQWQVADIMFNLANNNWIASNSA